MKKKTFSCFTCGEEHNIFDMVIASIMGTPRWVCKDCDPTKSDKTLV